MQAGRLSTSILCLRLMSSVVSFSQPALAQGKKPALRSQIEVLACMYEVAFCVIFRSTTNSLSYIPSHTTINQWHVVLTAVLLQGAFFGALVADALTLGTHYEYDAKKIKQFYGMIDKYYAPGEKTGGETHGIGWGARNYHGGNGRGEPKMAGGYHKACLFILLCVILLNAEAYSKFEVLSTFFISLPFSLSLSLSLSLRAGEHTDCGD